VIRQLNLKNNKTGTAHYLEFIQIPNVFLRHIAGDGVSRATKGITNATVISKVIATEMRQTDMDGPIRVLRER
jgi:hypothetical protein